MLLRLLRQTLGVLDPPPLAEMHGHVDMGHGFAAVVEKAERQHCARPDVRPKVAMPPPGG